MSKDKEVEFCIYGVGTQAIGSCMLGASASALDIIIHTGPFMGNASAAAKAHIDISMGMSIGFIVGGCILITIAFTIWNVYLWGRDEASKSIAKTYAVGIIGSIAMTSVAFCAHRLHQVNLYTHTIIQILGNTPEVLAEIENTKNALIAGLVITLVVGIACSICYVFRVTNQNFERRAWYVDTKVNTNDGMDNDVFPIFK